jgi:hypothetical protein
MKIYTKYPTTVLINWKRFLGVIIISAVMMPVAIMSQSSADTVSAVNIGTAANFVLLAKTGISTTGTTQITGNIGISPVSATYITGFGLIEDASNTFSTSSLITGKVYAANYAVPTSTNLTAAINDLQTAYTDAAGRKLPSYTELYSGNVTGKTLTPGLYKWSTGVQISAAGVTISGTSKDVWIFQIAQNLTVANGAIVTLSGGASASNIFWQVAGEATLGLTATMQGIILCQTLISMNTGATLNGRALAQTAVTLNANTIIEPATLTAIKNSGSIPKEFALFQNYPNPFNPVTLISYQLPVSSRVSLKVFNILGIKVAELENGVQNAGRYNIIFDGSKFSSGVYFYQLRANSFLGTKKLLLLK